MWDKEWWCVLVTISEGSELQRWPPVLLPGGLLPFWNCGHSTSPAEDAEDNGTHTPLMTHLETQRGARHTVDTQHACQITLQLTTKPSAQMILKFRARAYDISGYHTIVYPSGFICITTTPLTAFLSYRFGFLHFDKHKIKTTLRWTTLRNKKWQKLMSNEWVGLTF